MHEILSIKDVSIDKLIYEMVDSDYALFLKESKQVEKKNTMDTGQMVRMSQKVYFSMNMNSYLTH